MAPVSQWLSIVLKINSAFGPGFTERYTPITTDLTVGRNITQLLANYRSRILAYGYTIVMAGCSVVPAAHRTRYSPAYLGTGIKLTDDATSFIVDGKQNNPNASMEWEFFTANNIGLTRGFRAIRDAWVNNNQLLFGTRVRDPLPATTPAPPGLIAGGTLTTPALPTTGSSYTSAIDKFIQVVGNFTCLADPRGQAAGQVELRPWVAVYGRGVGSRDTGPGYSRRKVRRKKKI